MKIEVLEPSGFCQGVANAMSLAVKLREENPTKVIVVLGMLVHNNDALMALQQLNIQTLFDKDKSLLELIDKIEPESLVILTAHGHSEQVELKLKERGLFYVDATCPIVKQSFANIAKAIKQGHEIIYIGKKNHPESNAALSISSKVHLFELGNKYERILKDEKPLIISQTTFSKIEIHKELDALKKLYPQANIIDGICRASESRQKALLSIKEPVDMIYIVGGHNSNNTDTLYKMALQQYKKAKVCKIENASEINKKDLNGLNYIAISSGASTPKQIIDEIVSVIESFGN